MTAAKTFLWICAISLLSAFIIAVLPWHAIMSWFSYIGIPTPDAHPLTEFMFRICFALLGTIGIFFVILARNPLAYGPMLKLAAYGLIIWGLISCSGGIYYSFPAITYVGDLVFCLVAGVYLIAFQRKQGQ